jgi:hypothetical protein
MADDGCWSSAAALHATTHGSVKRRRSGVGLGSERSGDCLECEWRLLADCGGDAIDSTWPSQASALVAAASTVGRSGVGQASAMGGGRTRIGIGGAWRRLMVDCSGVACDSTCPGQPSAMIAAAS